MGYHGLGEDGAVVQLRRDFMHGGAGKFAAGFNSAGMGVETGKRWQERGMNIDYAPGVMRHKPWRENAHETSQDHQRGIEGVYGLHQGVVERFAAVKSFVVQALGGQALRTSPGQTSCVLAVAEHGHHLGTLLFGPTLGAGGLHNRLHIGAGAGNQNDDVLHATSIIPAACRGTDWQDRTVVLKTGIAFSLLTAKHIYGSGLYP